VPPRTLPDDEGTDDDGDSADRDEDGRGVWVSTGEPLEIQKEEQPVHMSKLYRVEQLGSSVTVLTPKR
jgi:hypothetical protein